MSSVNESIVLVEIRTFTAEGGGKVEAIRSVVRSYLTERRAQEDLELMRQSLPDLDYRVLVIEHIDS